MERNKLWNLALILAVITVFYNMVEGLVSVIFGAVDGSLTLFGFGLDSFIEVLSGIGIWHMVRRLKKSGEEDRDKFERTALRITGISFYILTVGLLATVGWNIYKGYKPETTFWGIIISLISIMSMIVLILFKRFTGNALKSDAILADADCSKTCLYLSIILLVSSILYAIFKIGYIDSIGTLGIAYFAFQEGRESFDKSKGKVCCGCHDIKKERNNS